MKNERIMQIASTNNQLAARLRVFRAYAADRLSELERNDLKLAAERLEMLDNPSIGEIHGYYKRIDNPFESPIDNEL